MAKSLKDRVFEALKKEASNPLEVSRRLKVSRQYVAWQLLVLEKEGLIEYDVARNKWRPKSSRGIRKKGEGKEEFSSS